jgi:hypothetical protein
MLIYVCIFYESNYVFLCSAIENYYGRNILLFYETNELTNCNISRLIHLTKYSNIQRIENSDPASPLSRNVIAEVFKAPAGFEFGNRPTHLDPVTITDGNAKIAKEGQKLLLRIRNNTDKVLNFTVFDLQPDWGVSQIYPTILDGDFIPIDANREEFFPLDVGLPPNYTDGHGICYS